MDAQQHKPKRLIEKTVPKPVRKLFRHMNFHFTEAGRAIHQFAKTLPEEQRRDVTEHGKDLTTARAKKNLPRGVRNVTTSLIVGQGMWYFVCPALYHIDAVRESPFGWLAAGGLDKLFLKSDDLLFQTGGYSAEVAAQAARGASGSVLLGATALGLELATDFSRCYIEAWSQKKFGIVADGVARAYGQVRPFPVRYSSLEAYQKIISYALRPWTIGTFNQIYSSVYGILGSIWRTGPQLAIVCTVGRAIDKVFKKISEWTGLKKIAERMIEDAAERERGALDAIKGIVGEQKFTALKLQLAAESKALWKWNPFKPAMSHDDACKAAEIVLEYQGLQRMLAECRDPQGCAEHSRDFRERLGECAGRLESVFGTKTIPKMAPSFQGFTELAWSKEMAKPNFTALEKLNASFGNVIEELQAERELQ